MKRRALLLAAGPLAALLVFVACNDSFDDPQQPDSGLTALPDAAVSGFCDPFGKFVRVDRLANVSTTGLLEGRPSLTSDERFIYFQHTEANQANHIYTSSRAQLANDFASPTEVAELHDVSDNVMSPTVSGDASTMIFGLQLDAGNLDLYGTSRGPDNTFVPPAPLATLNAAGIDRGASFSADGTKVYFSSDRLGPFGDGNDSDSIFVSLLQADGTFGAAVALTDPTTPSGQLVGYNPTPSADGKYLYFARRSDAADHMFVAALSNTGVTNVQALQAVLGTYFFAPESSEFPGFISPDGCRLYFSSDAAGDFDLYVASRR